MKNKLMTVVVGGLVLSSLANAASTAPSALSPRGKILSSCAAQLDNLCNAFPAYCKISSVPAPMLDKSSRTWMDGQDSGGRSLPMRGSVSIHSVPGGYSASLTNFEVDDRRLLGPTFGWKPSLYSCTFKGDKTKAHRLTVLVQTGASNSPDARYVFNMYRDPAVGPTRWTSSAGMLNDSTLEAAGQVGICRVPLLAAESDVQAKFTEAFGRYDAVRSSTHHSPCRGMAALHDCEREFRSVADLATANALHERQIESGCMRRTTTGAPAAAAAPTGAIPAK